MQCSFNDVELGLDCYLDGEGQLLSITGNPSGINFYYPKTKTCGKSIAEIPKMEKNLSP